MIPKLTPHQIGQLALKIKGSLERCPITPVNELSEEEMGALKDRAWEEDLKSQCDASNLIPIALKFPNYETLQRDHNGILEFLIDYYSENNDPPTE